MRRNCIVFCLGCLAFAGFMMWEAMRLRLGTLKAPGAGFWPFVTLSFFLVFSVLYLVTVLSRPEEKSDAPGRKISRYKPLVTMIALVLYGVFIERIGFILSTFLLMVILFRVDAPYRWRAVIGGAVASSIAMYAFFDLWLRVGLPRSPWGFF